MKKIISAISENETEYETTPKSDFFQWCLLNGSKMTEVSNDVDYDLFDYLWEDIKRIFRLDNKGCHVKGLGDCNDCVYGGDTNETIGSPCSNCRPSSNMFEQASN